MQHHFSDDFSESLSYVSSHFADISADANEEFMVDEMELISAQFDFDSRWFGLLELIQQSFI
jgi:hypothetical protein